MFTYKIDEKTALKMLHLHDAEPLFRLITVQRQLFLQGQKSRWGSFR